MAGFLPGSLIYEISTDQDNSDLEVICNRTYPKSWLQLYGADECTVYRERKMTPHLLYKDWSALGNAKAAYISFLASTSWKPKKARKSFPGTMILLGQS